jgi:hypothetical protein
MLVRKTRFTPGRVQELKNVRNSETVQNRTHVYVNFFETSMKSPPVYISYTYMLHYENVICSSSTLMDLWNTE